jgi:hypothetical protein
MAMKRRQYGPSRPWDSYPTKRILDLRLSELGVELEGSWVEDAIAHVHGELAHRGLRLRPKVYLADEWMSADGVPAVGVPFYLVHPRLMAIERSRMLAVEGGTWRECLRLLRHEIGHAFQHGYQLQRRRRFQEVFGPTTKAYPQSYRPNPASKRYVQHLDGWYAQSHPVEDFAETFAVWLTPRARWRRRYAGWGALKKLEYVDALMAEIGPKPPKERTRARPYAISALRQTLREHYEAKRAYYAPTFSGTYDRDLRRLFTGTDKASEPASKFLRRKRPEIRRLVSRWTGEYVFTVDQVLKQMIGRCQELKLRTPPGGDVTNDFAVLLTVHSMTYLYRVREDHAV